MYRPVLPTFAAAALLANLACGGNDASPAGSSCQAVAPDAGTASFRTCTPPGSPKFVDGKTISATQPPAGTCVKPPAAPVVSGYGVQKFGTQSVGTRLQFNVPPGTGSVSIISQGLAAQDFVTINDGGVSNSVAPTNVVDSTGRVLLDSPYTGQEGEDAGIWYGGLSPLTGAMTFPDSALLVNDVGGSCQLPAGNWSFTVDDLANDCKTFNNCADGGSGGSYDVTVVTKPLSPSSGTIDLAIYLVESSGYTSASATTEAASPALPMGRMMQTLETLLGRAGLCLGTVTFYGVPTWAQNAYATTINADQTDPCSTLDQMFATLGQAGNTLNLFLVSSITSTNSTGSTTVVGIDGTIAGPSGAAPTVHSGAAVSIADLSFGSPCGGSLNFGGCGADAVAYVAAHESGHWLGLYHTTEATGDMFDPLTDTARCPCSSCKPSSATQTCGSDPNTNYTMKVSDCTAGSSCGGGDNLMFWLTDSSSTGHISSQQAQVMRGNPAVQ